MDLEVGGRLVFPGCDIPRTPLEPQPDEQGHMLFTKS